MSGNKIVYPCDHVILETVSQDDSRDIVRGETNPNFDILSKYTVEKINRVKSSDSGTVYGDGTDYRKYLHNKILWTRTRVPIGQTYQVLFSYSLSQEITYTADDCPRCGGVGWYVDMINLTSGKMEIVYGIEKLAQDVMKMLLTELGTDRLATDYGTILSKIPGTTLKDNVLSSLGVIVAGVESTIKDTQAKSDLVIPSSELLSQLILEGAEYADSRMSRIIMSIEIINQDGQSIEANLGVGGV